MADAVHLRGFRELSAAFAHAEKEARDGFRTELRQVAEPVRRDAEAFARSTIPKAGVWAGMRVGVTRRSVYVAPRKRGVQGRDNRRRRPNFGTLLMDRAMQPALDRNAAGIEAAVELALDHLADRWER